jgi:hypothetical protein
LLLLQFELSAAAELLRDEDGTIFGEVRVIGLKRSSIWRECDALAGMAKQIEQGDIAHAWMLAHRLLEVGVGLEYVTQDMRSERAFAGLATMRILEPMRPTGKLS